MLQGDPENTESGQVGSTSLAYLNGQRDPFAKLTINSAPSDPSRVGKKRHIFNVTTA